MAETVEDRLKALEIVLPDPAAPAGSYVPFVRTGNHLYISGQLPKEANGDLRRGQLGAGVSVEDGQEAAGLCAVHILAVARMALGELGRVRRCVKLLGFVNSAPGFTEQPKVVNGASELMVAALGEAGRHARSAVGVAALPFGVPVEVEAVLEVD